MTGARQGEGASAYVDDDAGGPVRDAGGDRRRDRLPARAGASYVNGAVIAGGRGTHGLTRVGGPRACSRGERARGRAGDSGTKGEERMDKAEIQEKVCTILAEHFDGREHGERGGAVPEDLDADSLDLVEAVLALEEEFGVSIPEEEMEGVQDGRAGGRPRRLEARGRRARDTEGVRATNDAGSS